MNLQALLTLSEAPEAKLGEYKGRRYRIKFMGKTKFGDRANLEFLDGSKNFWVASDQVKVVPGAPEPRGPSGHLGTVTQADMRKMLAAPTKAGGACVSCGAPLSPWERSHGLKRCADCRDGGSHARGGQSYYDRRGNFVLGDDD